MAATTDEEVVMTFFNAHNSHDAPAAMATLDDSFEGIFPGTKMSKTEYEKAIVDLLDSFPDITWNWTEEAAKSQEDGTIKIYLTTVTGTHSGKPYALGPFPEVEAAGVKCVNHNLPVFFKVANGKIVSMNAVPDDPNVPNGPAGFYVQIGGKME